MNFEHWLTVRDESLRGSETERDALTKMAEEASTFEDWRNVYYRALSGSGLERDSLSRMAELAKIFGQLLNVYEEIKEESVAETVLSQLVKLADKPQDVEWTKNEDSLKLIRITRWKKIFEISPPKSEVELRAVRNIMDLMRERKDREVRYKIGRFSLKI